MATQCERRCLSLGPSGIPPYNRTGSYKKALFAALLAGMVSDVTPGLAQVRLVRAMMRRSVPANACAPTPSPVDTFLITGPAASLWFEVQGAAAGDMAGSEWWAPGC